MKNDSPTKAMQEAEVVFTKVDDNIYKIRKDRGRVYGSAKFVVAIGVVSMLNNIKTKVAVLNREERRVLCTNFE
ncbi:hypothetical protein [Paenibacillus xylanexedens]|uniref:hypothetical protein n=1 Tax=Paenibacillus xylanexedens TaxID=528191 RepID=UPI00119F6C30|nr:hypothetical protein [Paenibacillus xylanexedens]